MSFKIQYGEIYRGKENLIRKLKENFKIQYGEIYSNCIIL